MSENLKDNKVAIRCSFCLTLNSLVLDASDDNSECEDCGKPILMDRPIKIAATDFDSSVLGSGIPVLVDFYTDWCGPCKMVAPIVDDIANAHTGEILVIKIDADRGPDIVKRFNVRGVPTLILFDGGEEIARSVGLEPENIEGMVKQALEMVSNNE